MSLKQSPHLDYLDGWRGIAIALVLVGHFGLDETLPGTSVLGVAFFFVLSGRLMAEILVVRRTDLRSFFVRRFARVYPGLAAFVIGASLLFDGTRLQNGPVAMLSALTFTINYGMIYGHPVALLDHLWSLCVEEHGYIVLAGIALLARRGHGRAGPLILLVGLAALANGILRSDVFGQTYFHVFWRSDVQIAPIFLGAAFHLALRETRFARNSGWIAPAALVLGVTLSLTRDDATLTFGAGTLALALAVATIDGARPAVLKALEFPALRLLGILSFSIYLWQQPFYKLARAHAATAPVLLGLGICAGIASFLIVERPGRGFINRHWSSRRRAEAGPPL